MSLKKAAFVAGIGLLIMTISWLVSDYFVFQNLIEPENANQTTTNIRLNEVQFRAGIFGLFIVLFCDLIVAWALYFFLRPVSESISLFIAWLRLVYSIFLGIALLNYVDVVQLINGTEYLKAFEIDTVNAKIMLSLDSFYRDWNFGLIFFGFHLALLGYLSLKANYIPKVISILLALAGLSYLVDYFGEMLFTDFKISFSLFLGWGELVFMLWLLIKGPKIQEQET